MMVKNYILGDLELLITQQGDKYAAIKIIKGKNAEYHKNLDYESADDIWDHWLDESLEKDVI